MRLAVVTDIHGNLTALEAIIGDVRARGVDVVVHGGDLALMGPRPAEVIDRIRELGWQGVVGNTDELLWRPEEQARLSERAPGLARLLRWLFEAYAPDTLERLGEERVEWLRSLPTALRVGELTVVHAAPDELWQAPLPDVSDGELESVYGPLHADTVVYGHIHRPFVRSLQTTTVANSGSVGMPWDGDPRASYLVIDEHGPEVIRVAYDVEVEAREMLGRGHPDAKRLIDMRRQGRFIHPNPFPSTKARTT